MDGNIEGRLTELEKKGANSSFFSLLEKLLIPLALGLLGYVANNASNNIAEAQLELAKAKHVLADSQFHLAKAQENRAVKESESATRRAIEESKVAKQLKYIELIYKDISSQDKNRQLQALGLLLSLDQEVGLTLAKAVNSNPSYDKEVRDRAQLVMRSINKYGSLINYNIGIYVEEGDHQLQQYAGKLMRAFRDNGFPGHVSVYVKPNQFFEKARRLDYSHIRYEKGSEEHPAEMLHTLLKEINPGRQFKLLKTLQPSPSFLSIFPVGSPDNFRFNHNNNTFEEFIPAQNTEAKIIENPDPNSEPIQPPRLPILLLE